MIIKWHIFVRLFAVTAFVSGWRPRLVSYYTKDRTFLDCFGAEIKTDVSSNFTKLPDDRRSSIFFFESLICCLNTIINLKYKQKDFKLVYRCVNISWYSFMEYWFTCCNAHHIY